MTTALTPIINQMQTDSDRLRALVNGTENDTVELENRTSKSVAGLVKEAIDTSAIDLNNAVQSAQSSATDAANSKTAAAQSETNTATAKASVDLTKSQIDSIKTDIDSIKTDIDLKYDEINTAKDDIDVKYGEIQTFRNETEVFANDVTEKSDQVANTLVQTQELSATVAATATEIREESAKFSTYIKKPVILFPTSTINSDDKRVSVTPVYESYEYLFSDVSRKLNLYVVLNAGDQDSNGDVVDSETLELVNSYEFNSLNVIISDNLEIEKVYAIEVIDSAQYQGSMYQSDPSDQIRFTVDDSAVYVDTPTIISGTNQLSPEFVFSDFSLSSGDTGNHTTTEVIAIIDKKKVYRFDSLNAVTSHRIPLGVLRPSNNYDIFVRYYDENFGWSPYSNKYQITTEDPITQEQIGGIEDDVTSLDNRVTVNEQNIQQLQDVDFSQVSADRQAAEEARDEAVSAKDTTLTSEENARVYAENSQTSSENAAGFSQSASDSSVAASDSEQASADYVLQAQQILLEISQRSAGSFMVMGVWDASTATYPTPDSPSQPSLWIVGNAGTNGTTMADGITYNNKDYLVYTPNEDGTDGTYAVVSNNDSVVSVNGKQGTVVINATDIGLGNVRNVASYSQTEADGRFDPIGAAQAVSDNMNTIVQTHINNKDNPHGTTAAHVNLGNVRNVASYSQTEADTKFAPKENANFSNMPQVAGDAIIEVVRNSNGTAIKFASGYMKCFYSETTLRTTSTTGSSGGGLGGSMGFYVANSVPLTFPVPFVGSRPVVTPACSTAGANTSESSSAPVWGFLRTSSLTSVNVGLMSYSNNSQGYIGYVAEGFWK